VLGSDDETPSPEQSPKYQESNDRSSTIDTDDGGGGMEEINTVLNHPVVVQSSQVSITNYLCYLSAHFFETSLMLHLLFQERRTLLTSHRIQIMMHHHLRGSL
jgi:hypothetical protein